MIQYSPKYGADNPRPLSTELVSEEKYDEYGNRREMDIAGSVKMLNY